jgi:hypothetical protein
MADFFKNLTQAPRGNAARVQSAALRRRGLDMQPKLVHPDDRNKSAAATNAKRVGSRKHGNLMCSLFVPIPLTTPSPSSSRNSSTLPFSLHNATSCVRRAAASLASVLAAVVRSKPAGYWASSGWCV